MDIEISLDQKSIKDAIREIKRYKRGLKDLNKEFVDSLLDHGVVVADSSLPHLGDDYVDYDVNRTKATSHGYESTGKVNLKGKDAAFIEFGAGVTYADVQNPLASKNGMGVGTYPGQKHAWNPAGWYYWAEGSGPKELKHSYGIRPYCPLYNAEESMREYAFNVAKQCFGKE